MNIRPAIFLNIAHLKKHTSRNVKALSQAIFIIAHIIMFQVFEWSQFIDLRYYFKVIKVVEHWIRITGSSNI